MILPLFKGKGVKANNKDNYRGITLFPTLCKIYEMILLNRLETYTTEKGYFSELQFGFREGVGCIEASFIILETINHMLERGSKVFSCFLDVRKAFDTVWIDGLLYKLFSDLGINGKMWLAIKDLYTDVQAQVLCDGTLSRLFEIGQGTGQGRILAPFMYKVYINGLLRTLSDHCLAISINTLSLPSPSFADDVTLLALFPSFLKALMSICYDYSVTWRYEFNHSKSEIVTFGETKPIHAQSLKKREWFLGNTLVDELSEYKNLGVLKNCFNSFSSNIEDNIEKTRKKAGMIFSSDFDRRKTKPLVFIKFWKQACLPTLLFGAELFSITTSQSSKLERCQQWFLKKLFYVPNFAPSRLLLKFSDLNSIESEIDLKKLLFLGRLITESKMAPVVKSLFLTRVESYFSSNYPSTGVLSSICDALRKYDLLQFLESWHSLSIFPSYTEWKSIVKSRIRMHESDIWDEYCIKHPGFLVAQAFFKNVTSDQFWSIADLFPDLVSHLHVQLRLLSNLGLCGGIPWLLNTDGALCYICKKDKEDVGHFLCDRASFKENFDSIWSNLNLKVLSSNPTDGVQIANFIASLDRQGKVLLLVGGLSLPFDRDTVILIKRFLCSAVGRMYKLRKEKLLELSAPWLTK